MPESLETRFSFIPFTMSGFSPSKSSVNLLTPPVVTSKVCAVPSATSNLAAASSFFPPAKWSAGAGRSCASKKASGPPTRPALPSNLGPPSSQSPYPGENPLWFHLPGAIHKTLRLLAASACIPFLTRKNDTDPHRRPHSHQGLAFSEPIAFTKAVRDVVMRLSGRDEQADKE